MQNTTANRSNGLGQGISQDELDGDRQFSENVIGYSNQVEEIITWLFRKEEELQQRPPEFSLKAVSFNQILDEYSIHEKFMTELCEYCHTIMRCKEYGQELRDDETLSDEDHDEVGIQMDAMMVCYEKLKILTTDRLKNLQKIIEDCQRSKIERLEDWLTSMELKIASSNNIGPDYESIKRQIQDIEELKHELAQKQDFLNFISKVIIFDDIDTDSLQIRARSSETIDKRLDSMNQRWTNICRFVDDRNDKLRRAESIWKLLHLQGPQLAAWLKRIEGSLIEVSEAVSSINNPVGEMTFISKLMSRSEKIDAEIKGKQTFYTSLENQVRAEIEQFEDPCSILVIELEKKLEDMQDSWNTIMRQKRMLDYKLQALTNPRPAETVQSMIPLPDPITSISNHDLRFNGISGTPSETTSKGHMDESFNNSVSSRNGDNEPSLNLISSSSDQKILENSLSSDTRSLLYDQNSYNNDSQVDISSPTELTSTAHQFHMSFAATADDPTDGATGFPDSNSPLMSNEHLHLGDKFAGIDNGFDAPDSMRHEHSDGAHSCRVEEWKHSLESFSNWLKQVETSLGMKGSLETMSQTRSWNQIDLQDRILLLRDIDNRIKTSCQDEFDCLFLQGQQIIEDLIPEIGENEYEANLKEILTDIEIRYGAVKRCLGDRRRELADKEKWGELSRRLRDSCETVIDKMGEVIPEKEIGVDLITLAQQQDQLMHLKEDLANDSMIQSSTNEAKNYLKLCDTLQHQYNSQSSGNYGGETWVDTDIWLSFKEFRETIEDQLDKLTLHYSELSQQIEDRLERLDEVHKEMHALQHKIQELATMLQVAEILRSNWVPLDNLSIEQLSEQLEDLKLYRERLSEIELIHKDMNNIFDWMEESYVPLSQSNMKRLDELNSIWETIQMSVEERQKLIEHAFDEQSGSEQKFLSQTVADLPSKWERRVATSKVPYFIDHESNKTLWDHPKFTILLEEMADLKQYVFSVYRTAVKLRIVQKALGIDMLMLEQLKEIFVYIDSIIVRQNVDTFEKQQPIQVATAITNETPIGVEHIILLLKAIYEKIQAEELPNLDVPLAIDLTLNWLLNLYDS